jgi:threonyl-tRNA synthetase
MDKIKIYFPDGSSKEFEKGVTPFRVAESISGKLADDSLVAEIDGIVKELNTPLLEDCKLKLLTFNDEEGKETYWHSTSHLMAHAVQSIYPEAKFGVGPAIDNGFYYDIDINSQLSEDDLRKIEEKMLEERHVPKERIK